MEISAEFDDGPQIDVSWGGDVARVEMITFLVAPPPPPSPLPHYSNHRLGLYFLYIRISDLSTQAGPSAPSSGIYLNHLPVGISYIPDMDILEALIHPFLGYP